MLKDITSYTIISAVSVACLGMLAVAMLKETLEDLGRESSDK